MQPGVRIKGRRGVELRRRRLEREPLCRMCAKEGRVTQADEVDHIQPIIQGGTDTDDNVQSLCFEHHLEKSIQDGTARGGASFHPEWLKPSTIPLTIICGPPASGKTTHARQHARPGDIIIDLDDIAREFDPSHTHGSLSDEVLVKAIRARNALLGTLSRCTEGKAWFIVSAPSPNERRWWQEKLGGEVVLLDPGADVCRRRALQRGTAIDGIANWYARARQDWKPRAPRVQIGVDGWPLD